MTFCNTFEMEEKFKPTCMRCGGTGQWPHWDKIHHQFPCVTTTYGITDEIIEALLREPTK